MSRKCGEIRSGVLPTVSGKYRRIPRRKSFERPREGRDFLCVAFACGCDLDKRESIGNVVDVVPQLLP